MDEIRAEIGRKKPIELFVDAREAVGGDSSHYCLLIRVLPAPADSYNQAR